MKRIPQRNVPDLKWNRVKATRSAGIQYAGLILLLAGFPLKAQTAESYTPPVPLDNIDTLIKQPSENGYALGALLAAYNGYQPPRTSTGNHAEEKKEPQTAVAREARKTAAARKEVKALQTQLAHMQANRAEDRKALDKLAAQRQIMTAKLAAADARAKAAEEKAVQAANQIADPQELVALRNQLTDTQNKFLLQDKVQIALRNQLAIVGENEKALTATQTKLQRRELELLEQNKQLSAAQGKLTDLEQQLAVANAEVITLKTKPSGPAVKLDTAADKKAYVIGQSIASSLRERLESYANTGVVLSNDSVSVGISDGLTGKMQLSRNEMDRIYQAFTEGLQQKVADKVKMAEQQLAAAVKGKKIAKTVDGMHYVVTKKGKAITDPDAPLSLSLIERVADGGRIISQVPRLMLSAEDDMPAVVREALPLLGVGAEVKSWAMARDIYGNLPLPKGIQPYTILSYDLKGL